jgi:hypothetical protein
MRRLTLVGGVLVLAVLSLLLPRRPKAIPLTKQRIQLQSAPDDVFQALSNFDRGPKVLERTARQLVAEFPVRVGRYEVTTLERVSLDPAKGLVTFEQLRSPFFSVRGATEVFALAPAAAGGTEVSLRGVIRPRFGAFGWLVTRFVVRPFWDRIDARFLEGLRVTD